MGDGRPATRNELRAFLREDFRRNASGGQRLTLVIFRLGQFCHASAGVLARLIRPLWRLADKLYLRTLVHAELPPQISCGPGLELPHVGRGVVIHEHASLGSDVRLYQRVTIGGREGRAPSIGDHVTVGAGAFLMGPIAIGDGAQIGANAVVVKDVQAATTVVGVPARSIIRREQQPEPSERGGADGS